MTPQEPSPASEPTPPTPPTLHWISGHRVILDTDLASMYGVKTMRFNEAFKRNQERFPEDFAFQVTGEEARNLISQIAISSSNIKSVTDMDYVGHGGRRTLPWVFTEHGAVMAANLLKSEQAVRMSVYVVRAFVRMREQIAANADVLLRLSEIYLSLLEHDVALRDIYHKLLPLLEPPPELPEPPRRPLGFHRD